MTKIYKVIKIEDYYVVVDKDITRIEKNEYYYHSNFWKKIDMGEVSNIKGHVKVIATIGKRIGELPLIEIEDEAMNVYYNYHNWDVEERKRRSIKEMAENSEFLQGYKAATKLYSEEDMIALNVAYWKETTPAYEGVPNFSAWLKDKDRGYVLNKPITSVELEGEYYGSPAIELNDKGFRLKVSETNTITPVNIFYE